jgi:septum formation protein
MNLPRLILASASPRRTELLRQLGISFETMASNVEELHNEQLTARELSQVNAYRKARAVAKQHPDALVLGADTLVYLDQKLFGKPANLAEAQGMLEALQGCTHEVVTGVCLVHLRRHRQIIFADSTWVTFKHLNSEQICRYLRAINPLDKAGAYAIQEHGEMIIREVRGSWNNVIGLPTERLHEALALFRV